MSERVEVWFELNGERQCYVGAPMVRLLDVIRERFGLTGTKEGCGEGECGACTVLLDGEPVCACLIPIFQLEGARVLTVEGVPEGPLQRAFVEAGGVQCGACTPGIIVRAYALLRDEPRPGRARIREAIAGNLCRCTGYERIVEAIELAAKRRAAQREEPAA